MNTMDNNDVSVEDEDEKFEQWLDDQLIGKYATGELETDLRMAVSTIRGMSKMTPKDFAVQPLMHFIARKEHEAYLRGQVALAQKVLAVSSGVHKIKGFTQAKRLQLLTDEMNKIIPSTFGIIEDAPTTNDTATDGGE